MEVHVGRTCLNILLIATCDSSKEVGESMREGGREENGNCVMSFHG